MVRVVEEGEGKMPLPRMVGVVEETLGKMYCKVPRMGPIKSMILEPCFSPNPQK